jgi:hypothetical protein
VEIYSMSILGVLAVCLLSLGLAMYSGVSKGRAGLLAGPVNDARGDNSLYRMDRVHMNSVEDWGHSRWQPCWPCWPGQCQSTG